MQFIEELVGYFSELITAEQRDEVERLWGLKPPAAAETADDAEEAADAAAEAADGGNEYDEYDEYDEYAPPAPHRRRGHAGGRRHSLPHRPVTPAELTAAFRKALREHWKADPVSRDILLGLARVRNGNRPADGKKTSEWRRFAAAVACLAELDEAELAENLMQLREERKTCSNGGLLFDEWARSMWRGDFTGLADEFCRRHVDGDAAGSTLAALRGIAYPENAQNGGNAKYYRSFMTDPEIAVIFDYYRVLRKLEHILRQTLEEAARRVRENGLS